MKTFPFWSRLTSDRRRRIAVRLSRQPVLEQVESAAVIRDGEAATSDHEFPSVLAAPVLATAEAGESSNIAPTAAGAIHEVLQRPTPLTWVFTGDSLSALGRQPTRGGSQVSYLIRLLRDRLQRTLDSFISSEAPQLRLQTLENELDHRILRFSPDFVFLTCGLTELSDGGETSLEFERRFHRIVQRLQEQRIRLVVNLPPFFSAVDDPREADRLIRLEALRACSAESGVTLVDHWSHWEQHVQSDWYRSDGIHPSEKGAIEMTRLIVQELGIEDPAASFPAAAAVVNSSY